MPGKVRGIRRSIRRYGGEQVLRESVVDVFGVILKRTEESLEKMLVRSAGSNEDSVNYWLLRNYR